MVKKDLKDTIEIPNEVHVEIGMPEIRIKGPNGEISRNFFYPKVKFEKKENKLTLSSKSATKKEKKMLKTFKSHLKNMIRGVQEDYVYKIKVCSSHFPITVSQEGKEIIIKNFLGEKVPRKAKIREGVNVEISKDTITLKGKDKEAVGQTAANLESRTRVIRRDRRKFQDGLYIIEKAGVKI